jgi:putative hydrolase of the HAD superfamily
MSQAPAVANTPIAGPVSPLRVLRCRQPVRQVVGRCPAEGRQRRPGACQHQADDRERLHTASDDTLWHNERSYRDGRDRFPEVLAAAGVELGDEEIDAFVDRTGLANLAYYGYGVSSFVLSLIEAAIELTEGRVGARDLGRLIDLAKHLLTEEIDLFAGAREALATLSSTYPLMLVTKGDLLHPTSKLERSGLQSYFSFVEVVSHKTRAVYAAILARHGVEPGQFLMVGNSLRSDAIR